MITRTRPRSGETATDPETTQASVPVRPAAGTLVPAVLLTVGWAVLCNLALEYLQQGGGAAELVRATVVGHAPIFLLGSLVVWVALLLLVAVTGRLWASCAVLLTAALALGLADNLKLQLRREPLFPSDLDFVGTPGFLVTMLSPGRLATLLLFLAAVAGVVLLIGRYAARRFPRVRRRTQPRLWRRLAVARLVCGAVCGGLLLYASHFSSPGNLLRAAYDASGSYWKPWSPAGNYLRNGFVGGTLYNLRVLAMPEPAGYSAAEMRRVADKYTRAAAAENQDRDPHALDDVNVVVVLSESFGDPTRLDGVSSSEDPMPFTRATSRRTTSGNLLAHDVGGGTANVEFESLTGLSVSQFTPQLTTPYQMLVPKYREFVSAARYLGAQGHRTIAVHPYSPEMYRRDEAYPALGFQEFVSETDLRDRTRIDDGRFISDSAAFHEVERQIRANSRPLFVNLVTMQNHGPYAGQYTDPMDVRGVTGYAAREAGAFERGLRHSDDSVKSFLGEISDSSEKTLVIFYGDHRPGFWPPDVRDTNGDRRMKETPFFIWSNFPTSTVRDHPTISPIYLLPTAFEAVGASVPPFYALLDELEQELPGLDLGSFIDADDRVIGADQLSPRARSLLHDYRMVQYDLSVGEKYSLTAMFDGDQ